MRKVSIGCFALLLLAFLPATVGRAAAVSPQAARQNNTGVALMEQQLLEKALAAFDAAHKADASAPVPLLNKGIALIYLRRLPEAQALLQQALAADPKSARAWYSLGIAQFAAADPKSALEAFGHAAALAPQDADTQYYLGAIESAQANYPAAVLSFQKSLALNPLQASAQYGLARALMRLGKAAEAREHLGRFQSITASKVGVLLSANYGEQGRLATAEDILSDQMAAPAMIPVKFVPAAKQEKAAASDVAGGCILDVQGTGEKDLISLSSGANVIHAYRLQAQGAATPLDLSSSGLAASGRGVACATGDYDNDGLPDLAVAMEDRVLLFHNLGHGRFADVTAKVGIHSLNHPRGLTFVDFDHDGDVDLFVTGRAQSQGPNVLWRNNGNNTFTEWTAQAGLSGTGESASVTLSDVNNDRAIDLVVTGNGAAPTIFENKREGAFASVPLFRQREAASRGVAALDWNHDGWMDLAVTHAGAPAITLWKNENGDRFTEVALPLKNASAAWGITPLDFDNDGWVDLAALVSSPAGERIHVFRNTGPGFLDVSDLLGLSATDTAGAKTLLATDVDGDGAADLVVPRGAMPPLVLHNVGGSRNHSVRLDLVGLADNKMALGTKVEVLANGMLQKFEVTGASGYLGQNSPELVVGIGAADRADVVRMVWPTGVPQDELDISADKAVTLHELDRRGSSCPVLFAWDGTRYRFVSDVIGAAVVGHWMSPLTRNESDSDEWIKVDGDLLKPRNGYLSVRFGEPMEEINYIDQLRMVAIDHPADTDVYPEERFLTEKPFASGKLVVASREAHLPVAAWGNKGEDVLPLLAKRDRNYVRDFTNIRYGGFAEPHTLTLDIGPWSPQNPLHLFLHGFVEYFSASSMYAAWQAGMHPEPPVLETQRPDGTWQVVLQDMGFPAGLPRTVVVDLTGKLPAGARKLRLRTNLQIYWDQILIDNGPHAGSEAHSHELPLGYASTSFRGYPKQIDGQTPGDLTYDYQQISRTGPFQWQRGGYTRYGSVTPLLQKRDDEDVVFGSGEEIDAEFNQQQLPPVPPHWKRDYFFYADGYVKDMDFYEASPFSVAEMPFHGMTKYPYPATEHFPASQYSLQWNSRFETGDRTQLFRFSYQPAASAPVQSER